MSKNPSAKYTKPLLKQSKSLKYHLPLNTIISFIVITDNDDKIIVERLLEITSELKNYKNYELIVIDNASSDTTISIINKLNRTIPQIRLIVLSKKYETEIAITAGLDNCIGDYIIVFNLYTDPVSIIPTLLNKLRAGYDIVSGKIYPESYLLKSPFSKIVFYLLKRIYPHDFFPHINYLRGFTRKAVISLTKIKRKRRHYNYLPTFIGYKKYLIKYTPLDKYLDKIKKLTTFSLLFKLVDSSISNSVRPLRFASLLGLIASFANVLFLIYVFFISLYKHRIAEGWISTSVIMGVMFFLLFIILTVISEYILKILGESRDEPLYFIQEEYDNSIFLNAKELNVL